MAFISITCPNCGGRAQIEAGRSAMCPYCACELNAQQEDQGFAFAKDMQFMQGMQAQDLQFAEPDFAQQNMQFAQPPVQQPVMQQPNVFAAPQMNPAQYAAQMQYRQYSQADLQMAQKRRRQWHILNITMIAVQALVLTFAIGLVDYFFEDDLGVMLILAWLFSQPVCAILSGAMRPDDAYIDRKPLFRKKLVQTIIHFLISLPASAAAGGIFYAILRIIAGIY